MPDLEDQLSVLGASLEWPPTPPDLWAGVSRRLAKERPVRRLAWSGRWALAAAAVLLIVATLLAYTPSREAIAGWLHLNVQRVETPPSPSHRPPGELGANLDLGTVTTLERAQTEVKWQIVFPSSLGRPDAIYVRQSPPARGEVTLVYGTRPDIPISGQTGVSVLVTEAQGAINEVFFQKMLGPDSTIESVSIGGHPGYWISGSPHAFAFTDANGSFYSETMRLATNTLIFDHSGTIVRIEGNMTKAQALQIASSLG